MKTVNFKKSLPYIVAVVIFIAISLAYMSPVLDGKELVQSDLVHYTGVAKEISDYREKTGEEALWTNALFGGMPAFQISVVYSMNIAIKLQAIIRSIIPYTADFVFIYLLGFFILLLALKTDPWLSIVGAIAFTFSTYHFIILAAGHTLKAYAIGYMAPTLAGIILTFRGKHIIGGALTALFLSLEIASNHLQITYYFLFIVFFWVLYEIITKIASNESKSLLKIFASLFVAVVIAVAVNFGNIWATYEYSKYTTRSKSELTIDNDTTTTGKSDKTTGLDKSYATGWSYGIGETFSLLLPNAKGGGNAPIGKNPKALSHVDTRLKNDIANQDQYWGDQPGTSGPVYAGAIVLFLFILSLFTEKNKVKWFLLGLVVLSILLSWGSNFMAFSDFFLDYFPGYNKFRAVSMTLVIAEFCIPLLAFIGLKSIIENPDMLKKNMKKIYITFAFTGGLSLVFYLMPKVFFSFFSERELESLLQYKVTNPDNANMIDLLMTNLEIARIYIFKSDAIRSFIFITLACGFLVLFAYKKVNRNVTIILLGVLILVDMWTIDKRYLNNNSFKTKKPISSYFPKSQADTEILKDTDPNYRVFSPDQNPFNDAYTSYYHKSIGGYHGAKLKRYQEIISFHLGGQKTINMNVLNMLNTKYVIRRTENGLIPIQNPGALGNAWFVKKDSIVENADAEIMALKDFNPTETAIIDKRFEKYVADLKLKYDSTANIKLVEYKPNKLTYSSQALSPQLAVFSEIYYMPGWKVSINGKPAEHFRANYILRAMVVPEGKNDIVFEFRPTSYYTGQKVSLAGSVLLILFLIFAGFQHYKPLLKKKE